MSKIDIDKFVCSLLQYANDNCEGIWVDYLCSSLQDQGLEYKGGTIVSMCDDCTNAKGCVNCENGEMKEMDYSNATVKQNDFAELSHPQSDKDTSDKKRVYTKKELYDIGFPFTANGDLVKPQEIEEDLRQYLKYKQEQWIGKAVEWIYEQQFDVPDIEKTIEDFRKYMEEQQ